MILTCIGDAAPYSLKKSRRGDSLLEAATEYIAKSRYPNTCVIDFFHWVVMKDNTALQVLIFHFAH